MTVVAGNLYQITAPHFCAGTIERNGRLIYAAPILRWTVGKTTAEVQAYAKRKGWRMVLVPDATHVGDGGEVTG